MNEESRIRNKLHEMSFGRMSMGRREFLTGFSSGIGSLLLTQNLLGAPLRTDEFFIARLRYGGGDWNTDMIGRGFPDGAEDNLLKKMTRDTMIRTKVGEFVVDPGDEVVRSLPFLYMTGHSGIRLTAQEAKNIGDAIRGGSLLYAEDCGGRPDIGFDKSFRMIVPQILPNARLTKIPMDHELFSSMFQIEKLRGGDKHVEDNMWGYEIDGRLAILYTRNDLGCAWEGHPCNPGGEAQRSHAYELGMNLVTYILTHS